MHKVYLVLIRSFLSRYRNLVISNPLEMTVYNKIFPLWINKRAQIKTSHFNYQHRPRFLRLYENPIVVKVNPFNNAAINYQSCSFFRIELNWNQFYCLNMIFRDELVLKFLRRRCFLISKWFRVTREVSVTYFFLSLEGIYFIESDIPVFLHFSNKLFTPWPFIVQDFVWFYRVTRSKFLFR